MSTTDAPRAAQAHITEVDGVPAVWADVPGPYRAGLVVRVGHSDETLPRYGVTHMLEHLALHGLNRPGDHSNGYVDSTTLALHVAAEPEDAARFLTRAAQQLVDPPVGRLEDEKGVLRTERAQRTGSPLNQLHMWRWGAAGFGLGAVGDEYGLLTLGPDAVRAWSAAWVNRNNTVLWFTGPPPSGLRVTLPDGERRPVADPYATPLPALPAFFRSDAPVAALHGLIGRSTAAVALTGVLRARLVDDLRVQRAAAYSPDVAYRPLSATAAAVIAYSDIVERKEPEVVRRVLETLHEMAWPEFAPREEELAAHRTMAQRGMAAAEDGMVGSTAWNILHGAPVQTFDQLQDELDRLTPEDVQAAAAELSATLLAQVPRRALVPPGWHEAPLCVAAPVTGGASYPHLGVRARLRVAPAGVTLTDPTSSLTVRSDQVAALLKWADGGRTLVGTDGSHLRVEPTVWFRGTRAVALIDAAVPAERSVPLGSRPTEHVPRVRFRQRMKRLFTSRVVVAILVVAGVGGVLFAANRASGSGLVGFPFFMLMFAVMALLRERNEP